MLGCHLKILLLFLALSSCFGPTTSSVRFGSENPYLHSEIVESPFYSAVVASWPDEQKLIFELLNNYDSAVRPVFNASKPVGISFSLSLIQISDMDEKNQILTANVWIEQEWKDERMEWNQTKYNNLDKLRVPCNRLWLPDIVLYNSADDYNKGFMQSKVMVNPNGNVFWPLPIKLRSSCKIDVTYFPFDDQVCSWKFGSWTYSGLQVDLINLKESGDLTNYVVSGEWHLISVTAHKNVVYYPCCPHEPYPDITIYIKMRRRILHFLYNIIVPCVWLSILSLIGFWLPPDSGEKISLGITVLLAFSVFMLLIAENIPATSETVPLIVIYLTFVMSLTSISIILTVFVSRLHNACSYYPPMTRKFYRFMTKYIAVYVGMGSIVKQYEERMELNSASKSTSLKKLNSCSELSQTKHSMRRESKSQKYYPNNHQQHQQQPQQKQQKAVTIARSQNPVSMLHQYENHHKPQNSIEIIQRGVTLPVLKCDCTINCEKDHLRKSIRKLHSDVNKLISKESANEDSIVASEWKLVGLIVDRFLFWLFGISCTLCSLFLLVVLPILKNRDII